LERLSGTQCLHIAVYITQNAKHFEGAMRKPKVCGPIVGTSNSAYKVSRWIGLRIVSSNSQLRITQIVISSFRHKNKQEVKVKTSYLLK
jgi:hypothetical protein